MATDDELSVDVVLVADDLRALASGVEMSVVTNDARVYWPLRFVMRCLLIVAAVLYPLVWIVVGLDVIVALIELRARRPGPVLPNYVVLNGRYSVTARGLERTSELGESVMWWHTVRDVSQTGSHVIIRIPGTAFVLPFRCFRSTEHRDRYVAELVRYARDPSRRVVAEDPLQVVEGGANGAE